MTEHANLQQSPLHESHTALGAKFAPFGGWQMPVSYDGRGVVAEHEAVRAGVGVFDVSHLGKAIIRGSGARRFVNACLTNDLDKIYPGKAQYSLCCDDDGGVIDDVILYLVSDDEVFAMPNAANTAEVVRRLKAAAPEGIEVLERHTGYAVLAVQGPRSREVMDSLQLPQPEDFMAYADAELQGRWVRVCRSGYTGEHGYELIVGWDDAPAAWHTLMDIVERLGGGPAGLGARDTLRTEMGYPLHGNELSREITPVQAMAGWAVGWDKPEFWGREALIAEREAGRKRRIRALKAVDRGVPRPGQPVLAADGSEIGRTTSGTFSPSLKTGIALALIDASAGVEPGDQVVIDVRGRKVRAEVAKAPLVASRVR